MRNFHLSTSVCRIMRLKFVEGFMSPVRVSISVIWVLRRVVMRSIKLSLGHLRGVLVCAEVRWQADVLREELGAAALVDPGAG